MKQALTPIRRRIRLLRAALGLLMGLLAGAAGCCALTAVSFFTPIEGIWRYLLAVFCACPLLLGLVFALWPIPIAYAAARADACGLKERARTALCFAKEEGDMFTLQRADAQAHLKALPLKQAMPVKADKRVWMPTLALMLATCVLLIVPNPQNDVLRGREYVRRELRAQAEAIEKAAETLDEQSLTEEERQELRRLTGEMAQELRQASDQREALSKLDEKQKQLDKLQKDIQQRIARQTAEALGSQSSLKGVGQAMESGSEAEMQQALSELAEKLADAEGAKEVAEQLAEAAEAAPAGAIQQGLMSSAAQAAAGNAQGALSNLSGAIASAGGTGANISALTRMARAGVASAGSGQGNSGTGQGAGQGAGQGQRAGGGAGMGTTQLDAGYKEGFTQAGGGRNPLQDRVGEYERIYDPTRLGGDNDPSLVQGEKGEGESQQIELSPGMGSLNGSVPYNQVIGEYSQAAAQAVQRGGLPATTQDWVNRYFDALID